MTNNTVKYAALGVSFIAAALIVCCLTCKSNNVLVVDVQRVKQTANPFVAVQMESKKHFDALRARISSEDKELQTEAVALQEKIEKSGRPASEFAQEIGALNEKRILLRKKIDVQQKMITEATQSALDQINPVTAKLLEEMADDKGAVVVLPKSIITYNKDCIDVTAEFVEMLNKANVNVIFPDPKQFSASTADVQPTQQPAQPTEAPASAETSEKKAEKQGDK